MISKGFFGEMIGSDLIKFESWIKCADSTVPLIGRKCTHTHANSCISSSIYNLFNITASYLHVAVSKKRAADLKLFNGSHKSKKKKTKQSGIVLRRPLIMISGFSDSRFRRMTDALECSIRFADRARFLISRVRQFKPNSQETFSSWFYNYTSQLFFEKYP